MVSDELLRRYRDIETDINSAARDLAARLNEAGAEGLIVEPPSISMLRVMEGGGRMSPIFMAEPVEISIPIPEEPAQ